MTIWKWMHGCKPTRYSGIFKTGMGYRVRVRAIDPRIGKPRERNEHFEGISIEEALIRQREMRAEIRGELPAERARVRYGDYVESLLKRKIATGELSTGKSQRSWADAQDLHLLPHFGEWFIDAIKRRDIEEWKVAQGVRVQRGDLSPNTANGWLRVLLSSLRTAVVELELAHDPTVGVKPLDTSTWTTYTEEEPNALTADEVPVFLEHALVLYPQHYAQLFLGIATGRRPCEMRPLRRTGPEADIRWHESAMMVRRSQVSGPAVNRTKTELRLKVKLPAKLLDTLQWHVDRLPVGKMRDSELLFPSLKGGYQSPNILAKPIKTIAKAAGIGKHLSPYFMRRTNKDLCRAAEIRDVVSMAISGHTTVEMHHHYSSVSAAEMQASLGKVVSLMEVRRAREAAAESGDAGGDAVGVAS